MKLDPKGDTKKEMSYWMKADLKEWAGEMRWRLPQIAGYYAVEVAGDGEKSLFHTGSSANMQKNRFYLHHHWMKRQEVISVRWKPSRRPFDWKLDESKLKEFFEKRGRWRSMTQMKTNGNYMGRTRKVFEAGEAALADAEVENSPTAMTAGDELIRLLGGGKK